MDFWRLPKIRVVRSGFVIFCFLDPWRRFRELFARARRNIARRVDLQPFCVDGLPLRLFVGAIWG